VNLLITGGAGAIGRAAARRMSGRMDLIIADRDREAAHALAAELRDDGHRAFAFAVDVRDSGSVTTMFERIDHEVGPVDALLHCAGIYWSKSIEAITGDDWDTMMATHVKGAFLCAQAALPQMCKRGAGIIVNMASDVAVSGLAASAAYAAATTAVYSLTKSLALEFASHNIRVNAVAPGAIETPALRDGKSDSEWKRFKAVRGAQVPMGRMGTPEDVAAVLDFLLSGRSSYLTGQIIHVNGGEVIW